MKTCMESIVGLHTKLRILGVPIIDRTKIYCDNLSAAKNSSLIESTLNKKHSAVVYHAVRWSVAAGIVKVGWVETGRNIADLFTKRIMRISNN